MVYDGIGQDDGINVNFISSQISLKKEFLLFEIDDEEWEKSEKIWLHFGCGICTSHFRFELLVKSSMATP